jgi:hypothetical protein
MLMPTIKITHSFDSLRAGETFFVDDEFVRRYSTYIEVIESDNAPDFYEEDEPVEDLLKVLDSAPVKRTAKPKKVTDGEPDQSSGDRPDEGEPSRPE